MIKKNSNIKFIDLDLPSGNLWGDKNFNNNRYYQWGDLHGYSKYQVGKEKIFEWDHYRFYRNNKLTKYNDSDNLLELLPEDDIVTLTLGKNYRIPRRKDFEELLEYTKRIYTESFAIFKSKINGNQIIFPFLGSAHSSVSTNTGNYCDYWSSSIQESLNSTAYRLYVYKEDVSMKYCFLRCYGCIIRPITIKFKIK